VGTAGRGLTSYTISVRADVVDITSDRPVSSDIFWLDTNVLLRYAYSKYPVHKLSLYDRFLKDALAASAGLFVSGLNQAEMFHVIEKIEREAYNSYHGVNIQTKEYRHGYPAERAQVISESEAAWLTVESIAAIVPMKIDGTATAQAMNDYKTLSMDGYDLFNVAMLFKDGINQVLSDDADFATVPGIIHFTANPKVVAAAAAAGKLIVR
jgi:predicted nucleic acid-binding protein